LVIKIQHHSQDRDNAFYNLLVERVHAYQIQAIGEKAKEKRRSRCWCIAGKYGRWRYRFFL